MSNRTREASEIKMFINQPEIDEVMKKDDHAIAYIILQNSILVQRNMDLNKQLCDFEKEKEELESYNERLESTRTCLQGYVHNEHDMMLKYKKLYEYNKDLHKNYHKALLITQIVPLIVFIFGLFMLNTYVVGTLYITLISLYVTVITCSYSSLYKQLHNTEIKDILEDISKTKKSNSYIDSLIDNM